ncbi:hypothetical protein B7767_40040 [Streptomyces sp. 13-12-16]|nr:hypothetical protein B7767_40040 [Streptomyces sp. 13-12-16]
MVPRCAAGPLAPLTSRVGSVPPQQITGGDDRLPQRKAALPFPPTAAGTDQGPSSRIIWVVNHGVVVRRYELSYPKEELLAPLIPRAATGRPRVEDRQVINGMVYKIRTGISRRDLPERYGFWQTAHTRFRHYAIDGAFIGALQQTQVRANAAGDRRTNYQ